MTPSGERDGRRFPEPSNAVGHRGEPREVGIPGEADVGRRVDGAGVGDGGQPVVPGVSRPWRKRRSSPATARRPPTSAGWWWSCRCR